MASKKIVSGLHILTKSSSRIAAACSARQYSSKRNLKKKAHTVQVNDNDDDYFNLRFTNATRYVNGNWGMTLIDEGPPKECTERVVMCDGGDVCLNHPKVYINLDTPGAHICKYCGLRYFKCDQ